jgi:hypothetical protein
MNRISFLVVETWSFVMFIQSIKPSFVKSLPNRWSLAGRHMDNVYQEVQGLLTDKRTSIPGKLTLGVDGHRDGTSRLVETVCEMKLGMCLYLTAMRLLTSRATAKNLLKALKETVGDRGHEFAAMVVDHGNMALLNAVASIFPWWILLGCCVHGLDLLLEDIAKIPKFKSVIKTIHSLHSLIKAHPLLVEEFISVLLNQNTVPHSTRLVLYPLTRFAYMYLMIQQFLKIHRILADVAESATFTAVMQSSISRAKGSEARDKCRAKWQRAEEHFDDRALRRAAKAVFYVLLPISKALFYIESDETPLSHLYPILQAIFDFVNSAFPPQIEDELGSAKAKVVAAVRLRVWGSASKVGILRDAHMAAFLCDPSARAAANNDSRLINSEVVLAAQRVLATMHHGKQQEIATLYAQLNSYTAGVNGPFAPYVQGCQATFAIKCTTRLHTV